MPPSWHNRAFFVAPCDLQASAGAGEGISGALCSPLCSQLSSGCVLPTPCQCHGAELPGWGCHYFSGRVGRAGGGWLGGWGHLASAQSVGHSPRDPLRCTPTVPGGHMAMKPPFPVRLSPSIQPSQQGFGAPGLGPLPTHSPSHPPSGGVQPQSGLSPAAALLLPGFAPLGACGVPSSCPRGEGSGWGLGGTPGEVVGAELGGVFLAGVGTLLFPSQLLLKAPSGQSHPACSPHSLAAAPGGTCGEHVPPRASGITACA